MNLIRRLDEKKLDDALRRIEQLESERIDYEAIAIMAAILTLCVKAGIFTEKQYRDEIAKAVAMTDQQKSSDDSRKQAQWTAP